MADNLSISCIDIEVAIMKEFNFRQNIIVPNITKMMGIVPFETDMLVVTKSGMAYGFEIKISKSDLKADFKKPQHVNINQFRYGKSGMERYYGKFKHFYYAVPEALKDSAMELIPDFCGLWCFRREMKGTQILNKFYEARPAKVLFKHKWSDAQKYEVARLGAMRIFSLKQSIINQQK